MAVTCSTAEEMSEGGGRGEQRQNSESNICLLENLRIDDHLPRAERRTRNCWYCLFIDKQLLTVGKITAPPAFYTNTEVVKLPRAIILDTILANFSKVFKHNKLKITMR